MNRIFRYGACRVLIKNSKILLTRKKSGSHKGLWGLPGGAIEFGEIPENTLKREFLEETALVVGLLELLTIATFTGKHENRGDPYEFHHVGIIYKVSDAAPMLDLAREEEGRWFCSVKSSGMKLTPFAKHVLKEGV